ncbi:hypothetical protein NPIL_119841, partial [Nephila pilipes]
GVRIQAIAQHHVLPSGGSPLASRDVDGIKGSSVYSVACEIGIHVQREYRHVYKEEPPHRNYNNRLDKQLMDNGSFWNTPYCGR